MASWNHDAEVAESGRCPEAMWGPEGERVRCGLAAGHGGSHDDWQAVLSGSSVPASNEGAE